MKHHSFASRPCATSLSGRTRLLFLSLVFMFSCGNSVVIPERDFVSILTDIYLSKSFFSAQGIYDARWQDTIPYNQHIVERYGYQWAQFDSTVSWYCLHPRQYQDVYEEVMARLSELERLVTEELDPPTELWTRKKEFYLPAEDESGTEPVNVLLKGVGTYVLSADIQVYPQDESLEPRIELYLWRSDTTAHGVSDTLWIEPLRKDGLMYEYRMEKTLLPGNEFTHLKGNWLQHGRHESDTTWRQRAEIKNLSVYHIPRKFD